VDDGKAKRNEYLKDSVQYPFEGYTWKAHDCTDAGDRVTHDCMDAGVRATQETKPRSSYRVYMGSMSI